MPFDLKLPNGKVLAEAGQPLQPHRGDALGHAARATSARKADLDGDGKLEFGEVLPDANVFKAAADAFALYAGKLDRAARAWKPTPSDAFTAVVVMVPTMSEYFGQWKTRASCSATRRRARRSTSSRASPTSATSSAACGSSTRASARRSRRSTRQQAAQTKRELDALWTYVGKLRAQETSGQAVHAAAGRRARPRRAGARDGDRRPGDAGCGPAQGEDRPVDGAARSSIARRVGGEPRARRRRVRRRRRAVGAPRPTSRLALSDAETELVLGSAPAARRARRRGARGAAEVVLAGRPAELRSRSTRSRAPSGPSREATSARFAAARADGLDGDPARVVRRGDRRDRGAATSRRRASWLLVREFRPPTRFSRAAADATLALDHLARGHAGTPAAAAARPQRPARHLRRPHPLRRSPPCARRDARRLRRPRGRGRGGASRGYWAILRPAYRAQRGRRERAAGRRGASRALAAQAAAGRGRRRRARARPSARSRASARRRSARTSSCAAPASSSASCSSCRSSTAAASSDGKVTLDFEIQEAITFRDGAAGALRRPRVDPARAATPPRRASSARRSRSSATRSPPRAAATRSPTRTTVEATTDEALDAHRRSYPPAWKDAAKTADFDVISATLDRLAGRRGRSGRVGQGRAGAPRGLRRLRARPGAAAPRARAVPLPRGRGLLLVRRGRRRRARPARQAQGDRGGDRRDPRRARRGARGLRGADRQPGPGSRVSVVTNSAIIVFREGLEAVLILAALMASMVGAQRRLPAAADGRRRCSRSSRASSRG